MLKKKYGKHYRRPFIVEFFGLPGAGKTTLSEELKIKLQNKGFTILGFEKLNEKRSFKIRSSKDIFKYLRFLFYCVCHINIIFYIFNFIWFEPVSKPRFKEVIFFLRTLHLLNDLKSEDVDIIIMEEGLIQSIWSLLLFTDLNFSSKKYRKLISKVERNFELTIYVHVNISADISNIRIENRDQMGRFKSYTTLKRLKLLQNRASVFNSIAKSLDINQKMKLVRVYNDNDFMENVNYVFDNVIKVVNGFD